MALFLLGSSSLRESDFECENAMAHLASCCAAFDVDEHACDTYEGCGTRTMPVLSTAESECIQALQCGDVQAHDLCKRVAALAPPGGATDAGVDGGAATKGGVCP